MSITQTIKNNKQGKNKSRTDKSLCYNCSKARHYVKNCYSKKKQSTKDSPWTMAAMKRSNEPDTSSILNQIATAHEDFHWIACYNDYCLYHHGDKENHNFFPQRPKKAKTKKQLTITVQTLLKLPKSSDFPLFVPINSKSENKNWNEKMID